MKKVRKDKSKQAQYSALIEQRENLQNRLSEIETELHYIPEQKRTLQTSYSRRQDIIDLALEREKILNDVEKEQLTELQKRRKEIQDKIEKLNEEIENLRKASPLNQKQLREKETRMSAYQSQLLKINSETHRLQSRISGTVKERYFLMKSWDEKDDLVVFSRRFNSKSGNIESEMSHLPRAQIDLAAANKLLNVLVYVMAALNLVLIVAELFGYYINFMTYHTLYWLGLFGLFVYNNIIYRKIDRVFVATYYCLHTSDIDIIYEDEKGERRTLRVKCYSFELLLSDKTSVNDLFTSTEADIIRAIDQRNQDLVLKFEKLLTQLETTEVALREEVQQLQLQNQILAARYERAYYNAKADVMREEKNIELERPPSQWIPVVNNVVTMLGIAGIVAIIGYAIPDQIGAEFFNISLSSGKAFIFGMVLGIILTIGTIRWMRGGGKIL